MSTPRPPQPEIDRRPVDFEYPYLTWRDRLRKLFPFDVVPSIKGVDLAPDYQKGEIQNVRAMQDAGFLFAFVQTNRGLWAHANVMEFCAPLFDAGMPVLPYALFYGTLSGVEQAELFLELAWKIWEKQGMKTASMLDIEVRDGVTVGTRVARSEDWFRKVRAESLMPVIKYSSPVLNSELLGNAPLGTVLGMVAHWTSAVEPIIPGGWTREKTRLWQYGVALKHSWVPAVPGMASDVDCDKYFGTYSQFVAEMTLNLGSASASPSPSASASPSPSASPSLPPEEDMDITEVVLARDLLNQFIAKHQGQPSPPSSSPSPSAEPVPTNVYWFKITEAPRANAFFISGVDNAETPKPIMSIYQDAQGNRVQCEYGKTCWRVVKSAIKAAGGVEYFKIYNIKDKALYVKKDSGDIVFT